MLPPALVRLLNEHGHLAEHVYDIGPGDASDRELLRYAFENEAVLVTKDEDFVDLVTVGEDIPTLVWIRVSNTRRAPLLAWFEPRIEQIVTMVESGNGLIELR